MKKSLSVFYDILCVFLSKVLSKRRFRDIFDLSKKILSESNKQILLYF